MVKERLSVIIPNYNHGHYLPELLFSLSHQSRAPDEVVIIDDGSTDESVSIIEELAKTYDSIIFYKHRINRGVIASLNRAMQLATGDFVTFPSADNFVLPGMYESSLTLLQQYPQAAFCCSDPKFYEEKTKRIRTQRLHLHSLPSYFSPEEVFALVKERSFCPGNLSHTLVIRREAMESVRIDGEYYAERLKWHCDFFSINVLAFRYGICYIPESFAMFRQTEESYCAQKRSWRERKKVYFDMVQLLQSKSFQDVRAQFQHSGILAEFSDSMLRVLLSHPPFYEFFTPQLIKRIIPATIHSWLLPLRIKLAKIPLAKKVYRFLKQNFFRKARQNKTWIEES